MPGHSEWVTAWAVCPGSKATPSYTCSLLQGSQQHLAHYWSGYHCDLSVAKEHLCLGSNLKLKHFLHQVTGMSSLQHEDSETPPGEFLPSLSTLQGCCGVQ